MTKNRKPATETEHIAGEQIPLMDVGPERSQALDDAITYWKGIVTKRLALQAKEATAKAKCKEIFAAEKLSRLPDGSITARVEHWKVVSKPTDEMFTATPIKE